ncbi:unnamed protein product [Vitrella brassicaformis CCMP3155]|uniref:Secreted protein n=1 Tax=Vitrella brassicaformis (strain CCMP3155) TaxID=1169540 RepID=A0A0G4EI10_VITBC|nr:unnamed protein product [Vitrella brassicaformis CCMP3155]|eukprot:CEL95877.1 unnamed protein product [Vitrella brassicaformis CCMP3155]
MRPPMQAVLLLYWSRRLRGLPSGRSGAGAFERRHDGGGGGFFIIDFRSLSLKGSLTVCTPRCCPWPSEAVVMR